MRYGLSIGNKRMTKRDNRYFRAKWRTGGLTKEEAEVAEIKRRERQRDKAMGKCIAWVLPGLLCTAAQETDAPSVPKELDLHVAPPESEKDGASARDVVGPLALWFVMAVEREMKLQQSFREEADESEARAAAVTVTLTVSVPAW